MHALKCDLCKTFYSPEDIDRSPDYSIHSGSTVYSRRLDLCPQCQFDLSNFVETHIRRDREGGHSNANSSV